MAFLSRSKLLVSTAAGIAIAAIVIAVTAFRPSSNSGQDDDSVLRIGAVLPLSKDQARYGEWIQEGLQLAADEINSRGGVGGKSIEIVFEDDQANPTEATSALRRVLDQINHPVVYGSWSSSCTLAMAPIVERQQVVLMAEALSPQITTAGDFVFRMQPSAPLYIERLAPFAYESLGVRRVAILHRNDDFGVDQAQVFKDFFEALGGTVVLTDSYQVDATTYRAQLTRIDALQPDAIFIAAYSEMGTIVRQVRALNDSVIVMGSVPTENPDLFTLAGEAAEGIVFPSHFDETSQAPEVVAFQATYTERLGRPAEGFAALAYDGLHVLAAAIEGAGDDAVAIRNKLYAMPAKPGVTGTTEFDEFGDVLKPVVIKIVNDGAFARHPEDD